MNSTASTPSGRHALEVPLAVLLGSVGYLTAILVLLFITPLNTRLSFAEIFRPPERAIWCSLVAAQVALWAILFPPLVTKLSGYWRTLRANPWGTGILLIALFLLFGLFIASHQDLPDKLKFPVEWQKPKIRVISLIGLTPMLLSLSGIYAVSVAAGELLSPGADRHDQVFSLLKFRRDLRTFLTMAGLIIGGATLTTGALHRALVALNKGFAYNPSLVLLYGAYGSGVIALVYVPAHLLLSRVGHRVVSNLVPQPSADPASLVKWRKDQDELESALDLKAGVAESLKGSLSLLYPLVGSGISILLGLGK